MVLRYILQLDSYYVQIRENADEVRDSSGIGVHDMAEVFHFQRCNLVDKCGGQLLLCRPESKLVSQALNSKWILLNSR